MPTHFLSSRITTAAPQLLLASAISITANLAAAGPVECPASISGSMIQLTNPPAGWKAFVPDSLYLHSAAPIDGPPEQLGDLAEFTERKRGAELSYTYHLNGKFPDGKWIKCAYGINGEVTLSRKIDDSTAQCTFAYRKGSKAGQNDIKISCE